MVRRGVVDDREEKTVDIMSEDIKEYLLSKYRTETEKLGSRYAIPVDGWLRRWGNEQGN